MIQKMKFRLIPEELFYLAVQANTADMSSTDCIIVAAEVSLMVISEVPKLFMALRRQRSNLNQIVSLAG